jgi:putative transposase
MTLNYKIPAGLRSKIAGIVRTLYPDGNGNYRAEHAGNGRAEIVSYNEALSWLRRPDCSTDNMPADSAAAARVRNGGLHYRQQLSAEAQDDVDLRKAIIAGVDYLAETGVKITAAALDKDHNRRIVREVASQLYTTRPINLAPRGGSSKFVALMPKGRTIIDYRDRYIGSGYDEMALPDQRWLRGNRTPRILTRMRELMTEAIEQIHLDLRKPNVSAALRHLRTLTTEENAKRKLNGLAPLTPVTNKTMANHIEMIGSTALAIARDGARAVANNRSRGNTDARALMIGELVEIDECKLSLITVVKKKGWWERLSANDQAALEEIDEIIRTRLWLVLMLDVATRMPLAWVLTGTPSKAATLEAIRMATRDKTREKVIYGCECDPIPAAGIGSIMGDNGYGIRNAAVKAATLGILGQSVDARSYHGVDKPYLERMFGSMESILINMIHGYTGRRAGALPGYDPIKNGVLDCEELYGLITRYLVDEYPNERHYGVTMMGRRPIQMKEYIDLNYGAIRLPSPHDRRIHLGWESKVRITDEGVKVFGLPYNSPELQAVRDQIDEKVSVFSDPDCTNHVTILIEGHPDPILADLSWTEMSDRTIPEFLAIAEAARAEDPEATEEFDAALARTRRKFFDQIHFIAVEHKLARSYMTISEAQKKAEVVAAGLHSPRRTPLAGTVQPGSVADEATTTGVRKVGPGFQPAIDGHVIQPGDGDDNTPQALPKPDTTGKLS